MEIRSEMIQVAAPGGSMPAQLARPAAAGRYPGVIVVQEAFGLTYLFISHNLAVVRHVANRVGVLYLGRLVEEAPSRELFATPQHPYTKMLLDAVPDIDMTGKQRAGVAGEIPNPINPPPGCHFHPRCPVMIAECKAIAPPVVDVGDARVRCILAGRT